MSNSAKTLTNSSKSCIYHLYNLDQYAYWRFYQPIHLFLYEKLQRPACALIRAWVCTLIGNNRIGSYKLESNREIPNTTSGIFSLYYHTYYLHNLGVNSLFIVFLSQQWKNARIVCRVTNLFSQNVAKKLAVIFSREIKVALQFFPEKKSSAFWERRCARKEVIFSIWARINVVKSSNIGGSHNNKQHEI